MLPHMRDRVSFLLLTLGQKQGVTKALSNSPWLVEQYVGLVYFHRSLPDGQAIKGNGPKGKLIFSFYISPWTEGLAIQKFLK